tara:strand:+ start:93 stop:488 length:396 start_codon:yes stop_codon:yes gene_type:complete
VRVLVCGGRDYDNREELYAVLDWIDNSWEGPGTIGPITVIISGHARGADSLAEQWAKDREVSLDIYPAEWDVYGKSAGFIRNQQMIDEGLPDLVVAFSGGKGTINMIKLSNQANIPLYNVRDPMGWTGRGV